MSNSATHTPRRIDDAAALDRLTLQLDAIFGEMISDIEFADLIGPFVRGLDTVGVE